MINRDTDSEITDVKISILLDGPVLGREVESGGAEGVRVTHFVPPMNFKNLHGEVGKIEQARPNNLSLETTRIAPQGYVAVQMIIEPKPEISSKGLVDLTYHYIGWKENRKQIRRVHPIIRRGQQIELDTTRQLPIKTPRTLAFYGDGVNWSIDFVEAVEKD